MRFLVGRSHADGVQCWSAVSTEQFARRAVEQKLPLQVDGRFNLPDEAAKAAVTAGRAAAGGHVCMQSLERWSAVTWELLLPGVLLITCEVSTSAGKQVDPAVLVMRPQIFSPPRLAEMVRQVAQLLAPYAVGGAAALQSPLHASVQRWGSALYPVPDGACDLH